jgi:hypothetical protein
MTLEKTNRTKSKVFIQKVNCDNFPKTLPSIIWIVLLALNTIPTFAQDKKDSSGNGDNVFNKMLDYSRPGKYHQLLADLAGNWTFKGRHFSGNPNPDSNKVVIEFSGTSVRKPFANGRFFIVELTSGKLQTLLSPIQDGKMIKVNAKEITTEGYDNVKRKFVLTRMANNIGSGMHYSEGDYDSTTKTIIYKRVDELVPGMKMKVQERFLILDNDHYTIEIYGERDGSIIKDTEINYTRVKRK